MIRLFKWTLYGLLLLLVLLVAALGILLGNADGITWLVRTADQAIAGDLKVDRVSGGLFGDLRIDGLHYTDPAMRVELGSLVLRWQPQALLGRRLQVDELSLADGRFEQLQPSPPSEPSEGPLQLPDIDLPLAIVLERVAVDNFVLVTASGEGGDEAGAAPPGDGERAAPLVIESVLLRARAEGSQLVVETLEARLPDLIDAELNGKVQTAGAWPLQLRDRLLLGLPDLPAFELGGRLSGDLGQLRLEQTVTGGVDAQLSATLGDPLDQLRWQVQLALRSVSDQVAALAGIDLPPDLHADLGGDGDLTQAKLALDLQLGTPAAALAAGGQAGAGAAETEPATAPDAAGGGQAAAAVAGPTTTRPASESALGPGPSFIELTAGVQFEDLVFDVHGRWRELQWPLVGSPQVVSEQGGLTLSGSADDYRFTLNAAIDGPDIPAGGWSANGSGSTERVALEALHADILGGRLTANARATWAPRVEWWAALSGDAIDPGYLAPDWPGGLDFSLRSSGTIDGDQRDITVVIEGLGGKLRDYPLAGSGEFRMLQDAMQFKDIRLSSGRAKVTANGSLETQWKLDWALDVADLAELLPDAEGRVKAGGKLTGDAALPNISAKLAAGKVLFQDLALERLDADIDLRLSPADGRQAAHIELRGSGLGPVDNRVDKLLLQVAGPFDQQQVRLSADHPLAAIALTAQGTLDLDQPGWRGTLAKLDLDGRDWGTWRLSEPVKLSASAEAVETSELCLGEGGTRLCAQADWTPDAGTAHASLRGFSFERLKPLLPAGLTELTGAIDLTADAVLGPQVTATADVEIKPGALVYRLDETRQARLRYRGGGLQADYGEQRVSAALNLDMEESGRIDLRLDSDRPALDQDPLSAPLAGKLDFDFKQLGLVTAFAPVVEKSEGLIEGRLKLGGKVAEPVIGGRVGLDMQALVVPDAGLDLSDLTLAVTGDGKKLRLAGGVSSGPGKLDFGGQAELNADKGWPATLTLKGDRFQAVALPEAQVLISPDIQVDYGQQGLKVRGKLFIPQARIRLRELPSGSRSVTSDLVIVDAGSDDEGEGLPIDARVSIALGNQVDFQGFGLRADLGGEITVTQKPGELPVGNGELGIEKGSYRSFGQALDIERGKVFYAGGTLTNPGLNVRASRPVNDLTVGVLVTGTAKRPRIRAFSSDPTMKEKDARSLLLTGTTEGSGDSATVFAGTQLTDKLSVGTNVSVDGNEKEFVARYRFNRKWSVQTTSSSTTSGGEVLYTIEFK